MRRLAILVLCLGVFAGFASRAAAAPEEELLFESLKNEPAKREHATKDADKKAQAKTTHAKPLSKKASKAMAYGHRRLITKAPPIPVINNASPNFYVGLHFGGGWSHFSSPLDSMSGNGSGIIGGGQFGWNYQVDNLVFGIEADISASGVRSSLSGDLGGTAVTGTARNEWFATLAGRFGFATGRTLSYLKAGGAWTRYKWDFTAAGVGDASASENRSGWVVGIGWEQALSGTISAKIEYNYLDFGTRTDTLATTGGLIATPTDVRLNAHLIKLGLNHRFYSF